MRRGLSCDVMFATFLLVFDWLSVCLSFFPFACNCGISCHRASSARAAIGLLRGVHLKTCLSLVCFSRLIFCVVVIFLARRMKRNQ